MEHVSGDRSDNDSKERRACQASQRRQVQPSRPATSPPPLLPFATSSSSGPPAPARPPSSRPSSRATGAINRTGRVEDGTTVSDYDEAEIRQQRSVGLSLAPIMAGDSVKINLLDAPGYADFVGELRAGLRAADCALFVISASEGVDGATRRCGRSARASGCRAAS